MKTFLKILLIALGIVIAIKLLPVTIAAVCILAVAAMVLVVASASAAAVLFCVALIFAAALSPIWLPILAIVGLISVVRKYRHRSTA